LIPATVPNENIALMMVVAAVTPAMLITNDALWFRKGLCGPLPAMELLAAV
jgi:hypothetical protein